MSNRYFEIPILKNPNGKRFYSTVRYPSVPLSPTDVYILCNATDRYDKLAQSYYGDSSLWWIISIANNASSQDSLFPPLDVYIRIPQDYLSIEQEFNILNPEPQMLGENGINNNLNESNSPNNNQVGLGGNPGGSSIY